MSGGTASCPSCCDSTSSNFTTGAWTVNITGGQNCASQCIVDHCHGGANGCVHFVSLTDSIDLGSTCICQGKATQFQGTGCTA